MSAYPDVGLLVVTHENLAAELVHATRKIVGDVKHLHGVSIGWDHNVEEARERVQQGMKAVRRKGGILICTDMFGGTPTNISLSYMERDVVEIVTGVNLPMLIKFFNLGDGLSLKEIAEQIRDKGRESIHIAMEYLQPEAR